MAFRGNPAEEDLYVFGRHAPVTRQRTSEYCSSFQRVRSEQERRGEKRKLVVSVGAKLRIRALTALKSICIKVWIRDVKLSKRCWDMGQDSEILT
eukprot:752151-Hanusia_phi.AAC.4